jgi:hypothetical protein
MLGARERGGVVGERGAREIIRRKASHDLLPPGDALARVRFGQGPEVPRAAIGRVGGDGAVREVSHDVRAASRQPVGIRENDQGARIRRLISDDPLVDRRRDLGDVAEWFDCCNEGVGHRRRGDVVEACAQMRRVARGLVFVDRCSKFGAQV